MSRTDEGKEILLYFLRAGADCSWGEGGIWLEFDAADVEQPVMEGWKMQGNGS